MTEQERASALVARSRRLSRHRRLRTQRSGSGGSGTSVADSVGSLRGSTPVLSTSGGVRKGGFECFPRLRGERDRRTARGPGPGLQLGTGVALMSGRPDTHTLAFSQVSLEGGGFVGFGPAPG